jgi:hypothetical protein
LWIKSSALDYLIIRSLPDPVVDLADAHELFCQRSTQVDLPTAQADSPAAGEDAGVVVKRVIVARQ